MKKLLKRVADTCLSPLARSSAAKELMDDPGYRQAVKDVIEDIQQEWLHCESKERREELHRDTRALQRVTEKLANYYKPPEE